MRLGSKIKKLRGRGVRELLGRSRQAFLSFAERNGLSSQIELPSDQTLLALLNSDISSLEKFLERFRTRSAPQFFPGVIGPNETVKTLLERWPEVGSEILKTADRIRSGRFDLLGYRDLRFGDLIDWHLEPISGKRSPLVHWSRVDELDTETVGDQKIVRELSRHQYFVTLGQAYLLTKDEQYAQTFVSHLESWMAQNPPKLGTHWGSGLEIAFRSISWIWSLYLFKDSPLLTSEVFIQILKFLYLNARHLEAYPSTYSSPNTHLTGEALGLFYLGTLLPEFNRAKHWKDAGRKILLDQLSKHVRPDGVYFEQSSYYHRYTADIYTHFFILSRLNGEALPAYVEVKLKALMDHLMYITRPDGTTPFFGDDDGGRLMFLDRSSYPNDFGAVLSNGASLFARPDYKFIARHLRLETLWLLGLEGLREFDLLQSLEPDKRSAAFQNGGYFVMRDGWSSDSNYLLFDCGPHGILNCGHAHADALSFEIAAKGRTLFVDPGTYTYTGSKVARDSFRSSTSHNTLTIDGESSSVTAGPFSWKEIAESESVEWINQRRFDFVSGSHHGYQRLPEPVTHIRSIFFLKNGYWMIQDRVGSKGRHQADLWLHFSPNALPELVDQNPVTLRERSADIVVFGVEGEWKPKNGWVSQCFGSKETAPVWVFSAMVSGDEELVTFVLPQTAGLKEKLSVHEIETIGGKGFEVNHEHGLDIVMIGNQKGSQVETERLASDFAWTWARFSSREDDAPIELILLDGAMVKLDGHEILKSNTPIQFLMASRVGHQFTVETNAGMLELRQPVSDFTSAFARFSDTQVL